MEKRAATRQITFEGGLVPAPALLDSERILGTIQAGWWDLGLFRALLGHKEQLVVTTHRLMQFSRRLFSGDLRCLELAKVEVIEVRSAIHLPQMLAGLILMLAAGLALGEQQLLRDWGREFVPGLRVFVSLLFLTGLILVLLAWGKRLRVAAGRHAVELPLRSLNVGESKSFVDLVSRALRQLEKESRVPPRLPPLAANGTWSIADFRRRAATPRKSN